MMSLNKPLPPKWRSSDKAVRAVQVAFYVDEQVQQNIRQSACLQGVSPSDMIRNIIKLPVTAPPKRPRLTASFTPHDYQILAKRYQLDASDTLNIKRKVMAELIGHSQNKPS